MSDQPRYAKHPVTALAGPYGHPLHPAIVPLPIGAWVCSFLLDVASRFAAAPPWLGDASRWLIAIGVAGALLAASVGFLDLMAIPTGTPAFRTGLLHMTCNLVAATAYVVNVALRGAGRPALWAIVLSAVSLALVTVAGYLGGKLAYRYGVRVATEDVQSEGFRST
jgi:uncharacterized membrane protein